MSEIFLLYLCEVSGHYLRAMNAMMYKQDHNGSKVWRFPCKCELWNLQLVTPETFGCLVFVEMTQPQHNIAAKLNLNEFLLEILIDIFP